MQRILRIFIALIFSFTGACVSKPVHEVKNLNLDKVNATGLPSRSVNDLQYSEMVYSTAKLPLEDFFNGVMTGQFIDALKNLDILYHPSNTDNDVLLELINHGIVPVFVSIQNKGSTAVQFNPQNFVLVDNSTNLSPISKAEIPNRITRFSATNAAKNVVNVGAVVVLMAAVLAVLVAARTSLPGTLTDTGMGTGSNGELYELKGTTIITKVEYGKLILENTILQPGETVQGLLFFQTKNQKPPAKPQLQLRL